LNVAYSESPATPTDLEEEYEEYYTFEDDDYGYISLELIERKVFLQFLKEPTYYGDEVTLIATLVDFRENDIYRFEWEESKDGEEWEVIVGANEQTYTFIIDQENVTHYWRVIVILEVEE
jgi:hypothetical protein